MTTFEEKVNQRLVDTGLTMQVLADRVGLPEPKLRALCEGNNPRLSELEQLGEALRIDPAYFLPRIKQVGSFNQAGYGNVQKIKIGKAAAHELVAELATCRRVLDMSTELLAAKKEIINLLRASSNHPC
jgi:transcriptional regulator with XRE-family HTH domain